MSKISRKIIKPVLLLITVLVANNLQAQEIWNSYSHTISEQGYTGHKFRLKAFIRTEIEDAAAYAQLWIRVDKNAFSPTHFGKPIRSNDWKEFLIEGTVDSVYSQIVFGFISVYNGNFYLDDLHFEIETAEKKWKTIYSTDFENDFADWKKGMNSGNTAINPLFKGELHNGKAKSGNQCFLVYSRGVPNYGANNVGKYAEVNGIKLYYEVYGEGPPLVVLHGNGGSISGGSLHYPELIKKYKLIAIDSRAQGKSTDTDLPLTYELMASDVNALLEELKIDSAFVWGQSDGAILGLILAMNSPRKVKKVLAFGANIQPDTTALFSWAVNAIAKDAKDNPNPKTKKLNQLMRDHPNIPFTNLSKINIPVLIMAGDRDAIRPEHTLKLFQNIPKSQLCILPGTTHGTAWEKPDLFLRILTDFFDKPFTMPSSNYLFN
ncbi:MAG TPA: alpha/beta hydrolase [Chitinophagaceae bacterium]|nr:alpha/beta hydrolase [Chitinophagaceae bacterium]